MEQSSLARRTSKNTKQLALWTGLWLVSLALVAFGPTLLWDYHKVMSVIAICVNLLMGVKMIMANKHHLEGLDELQQRIHLEAMALSLGCSMVFGAVYGLLDAVKLFDDVSNPANGLFVNPSNILFVMGLTYGLGMFLAHRKYA
ncbi:MAG: Uncharacterised protein [Glaciecola sp. HTCC2999]|jgi:hypothetical protein|nr:MAG: Uncharacterised protein [Glaciecola sp. HTCC2999]